MGEGGAGGDTGTAGEGGMPGSAGDTSGGTSGSAGSAGSGAASGAGGTSGGTAGSAGNAGMGGDAAGGAAGANGMGGPLFFDDFENGTGLWSPLTGSMWSTVVDGTNAYTETESVSQLRTSLATDTCWADQIVEARIKIIDFPGMSTGYFAAIFARMVDHQNAYFAAIDSSSETRFTIRTLLNGAINKVADDAEARVEITYGNWYDIKLEVIGTTLRATFTDDSTTHVITGMNSRIASGGVGVGVKNGDARFDDVRVTAP
jgi:hypothetical protein